MSALYNEIEPYAAEWLRNLEREGHIAAGRVDTRDIRKIRPDDVLGAVQFHAFAGIAGWSRALRLAGWPDDVPVWTGSCPCQPFSAAGKRGGFADERHLWPGWFRLIRECRPPVVFGEQVANSDGLWWLDVVSADLEGAGYAFGSADLCAAGIGAPHKRQRLWWVAYSNQKRHDRIDALLRQRRQEQDRGETARGGTFGCMGNADQDGIRRHSRGAPGTKAEGEYKRLKHRCLTDSTEPSGPWGEVEWVDCGDKLRPLKPGLEPLVDGFPGRVEQVGAYGNAIVPQVAAVFIRAVMEYLR